MSPGDYVDHIKSTVPFALDGMKVAFDCANGSAARTAKLLFSELGAECHMLSDKPDGVNINAGCGSTHMESLIDYVKSHPLTPELRLTEMPTDALQWTKMGIW